MQHENCHRHKLFLLIFVWLFEIVSGQSLLSENEIITVDLPPEGFGPYYVSIRRVVDCEIIARDARYKNIVEFNVIKHNYTHEEIVGFDYIPRSYRLSGLKVIPAIIKDGVKKFTYNTTFVEPCKDITWKYILKAIYNMDSGCIVPKGNYSMKGIFPNSIAHSIIGQNFVYKRLTVITEAFSEYGPSFCMDLTIDIRPIPQRQKSQKKSHKRKS